MLPFTLYQIVCSTFLLVLIFAVVYHIYTAIRTGAVSFGYKYYPPGYGCNKKKNPVAFWSILGIYGLSVTGCTSLVIFILTNPIV